MITCSQNGLSRLMGKRGKLSKNACNASLPPYMPE